MKIEVLEKDATNLRVAIRDADVPLMNALRRIALAEVPAMAIDDVVMIENSSILQDEMIAHRLGLVPLKTDLDNYNLPEDCECKSEFGCPNCRVTLTLNAESTDETRSVYSGELVSENIEVVPASDKIPIAKLAKGQKIKLEAYARLGKGKIHAKWQPTSGCGYKYYPKISIPAKGCEDCSKCVDICPKNTLVSKGNKIEVRDITSCTLCMDCVEVCPKKDDGIKVEWEKDAFILSIESSGALPPERILMEATKILDKQLKEFKQELKVAVQ
ncbi:MAG: DNA-directed RNA polymerase subunit D [Crenarchaeota archaeon]|nr:DNA-directed RNA polymerase subunit D [Thermoproteota archaeon]